MTALYFSGAEVAAHRTLLTDCGVSRFGFNATNLHRLIKKPEQWSVDGHLPDDAEWVLYADQGTTWPMVEPYLAQDPTMLIGPASWLTKDVGEVPFVPFWHPGLDTEPNLDMVALLDDAVKQQRTLRQVLARYSQGTLVGITGASRGVERLDVIVSSAWLEVQRHGETQVWSANKLHRYPNTQKAEARQRHAADMERLGVDSALVAADDRNEATKLAVFSWQEWETRHSRRNNLAVLPSSPQASARRHPSNAAVALTNTTPVARHDRILPAMVLTSVTSRFKDGTGQDVLEETAALASPTTSSRMCDTCFLAHNCPAVSPGSACAYAIPIEIRTKDQLQAAMRSMVEMQAQRVLFARFAEELDGQGADATVSSEMDRFFRVLKDMKDISDTRDVMKLQIEARAGGGMLSRLFGDEVGARAKAVSTPMEADDVIDAIDPGDPE
jgi:hypothetical protein